MFTEIRAVRNDGEREAIYRLRFETYCRKLNWIDVSECPGGQEKDKYDKLATHFIALENGRAIGTVRLIQQSRLPFPMEDEFSFSLPSRNAMEIDEAQAFYCGEISRLIALPDNGCLSRVVSLGLLQVLIRHSIHVGLTHWLQALHATSFRFIRSHGFRLRKFASGRRFMTSKMFPTVINIERSLSDFRDHQPLMFDFLSQDIKPEDVVTRSEQVLQARQA